MFARHAVLGPILLLQNAPFFVKIMLVPLQKPCEALRSKSPSLSASRQSLHIKHECFLRWRSTHRFDLFQAVRTHWIEAYTILCHDEIVVELRLQNQELSYLISSVLSLTLYTIFPLNFWHVLSTDSWRIRGERLWQAGFSVDTMTNLAPVTTRILYWHRLRGVGCAHVV